MGKTIRFHPSFADNLQAATDFYDDISIELGNRFRQRIRQQFRFVEKSPRASSCLRGSIRASPIENFPYVLLHQVEGDAIEFLGLFHAHSDQAGWFTR